MDEIDIPFREQIYSMNLFVFEGAPPEFGVN